jgi:hypothetical protein
MNMIPGKVGRGQASRTDDAMTLVSDLPDAGLRARRRVACRLLPLIFLVYIVNYIDRVNVSFANLRGCDFFDFP